MNKDLLFRKHPLVAAVFSVAAVFVLLFALYGLHRWTSEGHVMGRVEIAGVQLGGLTEPEARTALFEVQHTFQARNHTFSLLGEPVALVASETGLVLDVDDLLAQAMATGREGNFPYQFMWWLSHMFKTEELTPTGYANPLAIAAIFDEWDSRVIGQPPGHGGIHVEDGQLVAVHPVGGTGIDREAAIPLIEQTLLAIEPQPADLPTVLVVPALTNADVDRAFAEAQALTASSITLIAGEHNLIFSQEQLIAAYVGTTITEGTPGIVHHFDPEVVDRFLTPLRSQYEARPVDASFSISGDSISIIPGSKGTRIDENEASQNLLRAANSTNRRGVLPIVEGADPRTTTRMLEDMGIKHLVSQFTTYHPPNQDRVVNIQLMAATVSMATIPPGGRFDLNAFVGPRTEAKGYLPAPTIIGRELTDTIGGGVSQFATTMYNAVFWGGYQDIDHRPHTVWFDRYPEGIEATINWGGPDLIFGNNTDKHILIHTRYTPNSITVRLFGDNDGRVVKGEQTGGRTRMTVERAGGANARHVSATVSERFDFTEPQDPEYRADQEHGLNQITTIQNGREGWTVTVTRTITRGGQEVGRREWTVRYLAQRAIYLVHPCKVPNGGVACPTTTTTSTTSTTSTTIPDEDD